MTSEPKHHLFNPSPNRPIEDILATVAYGADLGTKQGTITTIYTIVPLAALQTRLAMDAEKTARKIVCLTWALIVLTVALLVLTGILAIRG